MQVQLDDDTGQSRIVDGNKPVLQYNYATVNPPAGYLEKVELVIGLKVFCWLDA